MISASTLDLSDTHQMYELKQTIIQFRNNRSKKEGYHHKNISAIGLPNPEHLLH